MRSQFIMVYFLLPFLSNAQVIDSLNTARDCGYMTSEEREMIYEINLVRSNPKSYIQFLQPHLKEAKQTLKDYGKGYRNYSLSITQSRKQGRTIETTDTIWYCVNEERLKAINSLINDLKKLKRLTVLKPDSGIYSAATKHVNDQISHNRTILHIGSDGSEPWDRIIKCSPSMSFGNENIAGNSAAKVTPRDIIIQLLIDEGILGYGHRYNLLDPAWTHVACKHHLYYTMHWWVQNFGVKKKKDQAF